MLFTYQILTRLTSVCDAECCYRQIWIIKIETKLFLMKLRKHIQHTNLIMIELKYII